MNKSTKIGPALFPFTLIYVVFLYFFYLKYVPLVKPFQLILIPILAVVFVLTIVNLRWGTLCFIFFFPLINNLPYFFGIFEHIPHAPTALVLFLFYFLGCLIHFTLYRPNLSINYPIFKPMMLFSVFILISVLITSFRYSNFYPFLSDGLYELITNVNRVTSGGAIMSTIFSSLNYVSGFVFFFILINTVRSKEYVKKILIVLLISTLFSLVFSYYQLVNDPSFGNTPRAVQYIEIGFKSLNSTFKDPNSFGIYLGIIVPLLLSIISILKKSMKIVPIIGILGAFFILPHTGSLSGILGLSVSLLFFLILLTRIAFKSKRSNPMSLKKIIITSGIILMCIAIVASILYISKDSMALKKFRMRIMSQGTNARSYLLSGGRITYFWDMALSMIRDYPLTGVGIGSYVIELPNYAELHEKPLRVTDSAENYFIHVGSELGIIGLFFSFWLFWEIFKQMRKKFKMILSTDKWKFIIAGISAGLVSFFINFFLHTYIGSYEIKYTFWLLVALIFVLGRSEKEGKKEFFGKKLIIISTFLVIVFSAVHLWNSTHSLSLKNRTEQFDLNQNFGFYKLEKTDDGREFRWTKGYGGTTIKIEKEIIEIPLLASHPDIIQEPVKVKIYMIKDFFKQKKLVDEIIMTESVWRIYEYTVSEELDQEVILLFKVSRTWNPQKTQGIQDPRNLGIAVGKIQFKDIN